MLNPVDRQRVVERLTRELGVPVAYGCHHWNETIYANSGRVVHRIAHIGPELWTYEMDGEAKIVPPGLVAAVITLELSHG